MNGQQHAGFYLGQGGRHDNKITGKINVHGLHPFNILQILRCNQRDGNIIDIQLVFFDQMNEQVHGTFKYIFKLNLV